MSACALPRPSAIASAKLANSTVSQSQNVICSSKPSPGPAGRRRRRSSRSVVSTLPTSTTNITGFFAIVRGWSLRNASHDARRGRSADPRSIAIACALCAIRTPVPCAISRCSTIGPRLRAGKNVSAPTITMTLTSSAENSGVVTGNVPGDGGTRFLRPRLPAIASIGMIMKNRPISIATPSVTLYQFVFARQAAERRAVVAGAGRERVEDLRQAVRARVRRCSTCRSAGDDRPRSPVNTRIVSGKTRTTSIAICTS